MQALGYGHKKCSFHHVLCMDGNRTSAVVLLLWDVSFVGWDAFADWHAFAGWNVFAFSGHGIIGFVDKDYKCLIENGCDERLENGHNSTSTLENRS